MNLRTPIVAASCAGIALGAAYAASPAGAVCVAALAMVIAWTARGLGGVERRWVVGWLAAAVVLRILAVAVLPWLVDPQRSSFATVFGGDASYMIQRSIWIAKTFVHTPFAPRDAFEAFEATYGWSGYTYVLALLHVFFGASPYATHLFSTVLFFWAMALLYRPVRDAFGPAAAFAGLAVVTTMPTLFAWSIAPLKEAPFYILAAVATRALIVLLRPRRIWQIPFAIVAMAAALWAVELARPQSALLVGAALGAGTAMWIAIRHQRMAAAGALVVTAFGLALAAGAIPTVGRRADATLTTSMKRHMGNVAVPGRSYGLLDETAYASGVELAQDRRAVARFVVRGVVRFFTVPEPWLLRPGPELVIIPQQMLWYAIVALIGVGVIFGLRRDALLTCVLAAFVAVGAVAIGLNSGNIGTLIRHRDTITPFAMWLSALGATGVIGRAPRRFNGLDAAVVAVPILLIVAGYGLFALFRVPPARIDRIEPTVFSTPRELRVHGSHLRPYLRAFVSSRGIRIQLLARMGVSYPSEATYFLQNANEALLKVPDLPPGIYDLGLFDGADEAAYVSRAFTVTATASAPTGVVVAEGRFVGVDQLSSGTLVAGAAITSDADEKVIEVLHVGADRPLVEAAGPGTWGTWMRIEGQSERAATLRIRCQLANNYCALAGQRVAAGQRLSLSFPNVTATFDVDAVRPDDSRWPLDQEPTRDAIVDFIGWPGAQAYVGVGTRDAGAPMNAPARPATIMRVVSVEPFVGDASLDGFLPGERLFMQQPLLRIRAVLRYPLLPSGEVEYRGHTAGLGSVVEFQTPQILLHGTIVGFVDGSGPVRP